MPDLKMLEKRVAELRARLILDRDIIRDMMTGYRPSRASLRTIEKNINAVLRKEG
jgi:hypothetical protein